MTSWPSSYSQMSRMSTPLWALAVSSTPARSAVLFRMVTSCAAPLSSGTSCLGPRFFSCFMFSHDPASESVDFRRSSSRNRLSPRHVARVRLTVSARFRSIASVTISSHIFGRSKTMQMEGLLTVHPSAELFSVCLQANL